MFLGKVRIITKRFHVKKNLDVLKVSWMKPLTKKLSFHTIVHSSSKYSKYWLLVRNVTRAILVTYSGHRFFLHLSCLRSLRVCIYCSHNKPFWSKYNKNVILHLIWPPWLIDFAVFSNPPLIKTPSPAHLFGNE